MIVPLLSVTKPSLTSLFFLGPVLAQTSRTLQMAAIESPGSTVTVGQTLTQIPLDAWLAVFGPTTFAALFVLALKLEKETPKRLAFVVLSQLMSSWGAGVLTFIYAEWQDWPDLLEVLAIFVAGLGGAKFIDMAVGYFMKRAEAHLPPLPPGAGGGNVPPQQP